MNSREYILRSVRFVAIALVVILILGLNGCGNSGTNAAVVKKTSVPDLLAGLPNLKPLDIESCMYTVEKRTARSMVPSPSDVRLEVKGSAVLSEAGSRTLRSGFKWKAVSRDTVPPSLLAIVPLGNVQVSEKLNETFADNPTLAHGFVVALPDDTWKRIYLLATDLDHPIE